MKRNVADASNVVWLAVVLCQGVAGCAKPGNEIAQVRGQVVMDEKAVASVEVAFWPQDDPLLEPFATVTNRDGNFSFSPNPAFGQVKPGRYVVMVKPLPAMRRAHQLLKKAGAEVAELPGCYASKDTTPLVVDLQPGVNDLRFSLLSH